MGGQPLSVSGASPTAFVGRATEQTFLGCWSGGFPGLSAAEKPTKLWGCLCLLQRKRRQVQRLVTPPRVWLGPGESQSLQLVNPVRLSPGMERETAESLTDGRLGMASQPMLLPTEGR